MHLSSWAIVFKQLSNAVVVTTNYYYYHTSMHMDDNNTKIMNLGRCQIR